MQDETGRRRNVYEEYINEYLLTFRTKPLSFRVQVIFVLKTDAKRYETSTRCRHLLEGCNCDFTLQFLITLFYRSEKD
jgi:hypothetical protein